MKNLYLALSIVGAVVPYTFLFRENGDELTG